MTSQHRISQHWLLALFLLLLTAALLPGRFLEGFLATRIQDAGHVVLGIVAAALLFGTTVFLHAKYRPLRVWAVAALFLLVIEVIQIPLQRDASWLDLLLGMGGAAAMLFFIAAARTVRSARKRNYRVLGVLFLLLALSPLLFSTVAYVARNARFPVLADFSSPLGRVFLRPHGVDYSHEQFVIEEERFSARMCMRPVNWPGISIDYVAPDWRGYKKLNFVLYAELDAPVDLELRVHDKQHSQEYSDRFNHSFSLHSGINRVEIPLDDIKHAPVTREMEMQAIQGIILFAPDLERPFCIRLGTLQLLP